MREFFSMQNRRRAVGNVLRIPGAWLLCLLFITGSPVFAQTTLQNVNVIQPYNGTSMKIDFALPSPDRVSSIEVTANGTAIGKDKIKFTPAEKVSNYHCAILLLVDKTLGNSKDTNDKSREKLWKTVRETLGKFAAVADDAPYQLGVATFSAGNFELLASMGSKKSIVNSAIDKLVFNGVSPELYLGTRRAIEWFSGTPADRKFIVLVSDGISNDKVATQQDVVQAAQKAHAHICTIGFPKSTEARDGVQRLGPLSDETGGYPLRADGSDPKLPADAESNLLRFVAAGGQAEIQADGLKSPIHLEGKLQTEFGKVYTFSQQVESSALETPAKPPTVDQTTPAPTPVHDTTLLGRLRGHVVLFSVALILVAAGVAIIIGLQRGKAPVETQIPESTTAFETDREPTYIPPPMDGEATQMPEPSARVYAWLVNLDADQTRYPITKSAIRIGRKSDNDIVMKNDSVSSHHAEVIKRGDKFFIADLEASNGVFIGGKRVEKATLTEGDVIELGEVRLRFTLTADAE